MAAARANVASSELAGRAQHRGEAKRSEAKSPRRNGHELGLRPGLRLGLVLVNVVD